MEMTLQRLIDERGVTLDDHLELEDIIAVTDGLQAQGDLIVLPLELAKTNGATIDKGAAWTDVPRAGIVVLDGTHDHTLIADDKTCRWTTQVHDSQNLALGALVCTQTAWLVHPEHGAAGLAASTYILRGTREQAQEIRRVAD